MSRFKKYYMPEDAVGVLGIPIQSRTTYDLKQNVVFNPIKVKPELGEGFVHLKDLGVRTKMDRAMQMQFNPLLKEGYCSGSNDYYPENPQMAKTTDDPNNPYSSSVTFTYI